MISRSLSRLLAERLALFPAVALVGPRQCGKTTLARKLGGRYFNLEDADERTRLDAQWHEVLAGKEPFCLRIPLGFTEFALERV